MARTTSNPRSRSERPASRRSPALTPRARRAAAKTVEPPAKAVDVAPAPPAAPAARRHEAPALLKPDTIRIIAVRNGQKIKVRDLDHLKKELAGDCWAWIDATSPSPETMSRLAAALRLHPLVASNILDQNQRARIEQIGDVFHIVIFAVDYETEARASEIDFVLSPKYLLSVHELDWDPYLAPKVHEDPEGHVARGPDYLLYALCDWIVDAYFPVLDRLADEIDQLQDDVVAKASPSALERVFVLKRELISLRRATSPAREIFNQLTNREAGVIAPDHIVYFRDVYDHLLRVTDELDNYRELVQGTLDVYLSTVNNNLSLIMKRLTGVTVLLAGIGAVAGIFGMSEAGLAFTGKEAGGFWLVAAFTVMVAVAAAVFLRKIDWI
jgi:magnesium transporter